MARAPKITWELLHHMIESGMGSGFGESYQPWIQIKRWNPSPVSTQVIEKLPPFKRSCHFLSKSEYDLALIFSWVGCEFREQFPLWPWPHPHPETGRDIANDKRLAQSSGLLDLCHDAGIKHGYFVGTAIPYIWTIDFAIYLPWVLDVTRSSCLVSVKPVANILNKKEDALDRTLEKLEIERRYADQIGANYHVGDHEAFPAMLISNLDLIHTAALIPSSHVAFNTKESFLDKHFDELIDAPLQFSIDVLTRDFGCNETTAALIQHHLLWHQVIDFDLSKPLSPIKSPSKGGIKLKAAIRKNLETSA